MQKDTVLNIQNVTQDIDVEEWGKINPEVLKKMVVSKEQKELENGNIEIKIILDPKKGRIKNGQRSSRCNN